MTTSALREGGGEDGLDIEQEEFAVDRPIDHPRGVDAVVSQGGDEGQGLPVSVRRIGLEAPPACSPAAQGRHVGLDPGFINEHQPRRVDPALVGLPTRSLARDIRPYLLLGQQSFF